MTTAAAPRLPKPPREVPACRDMSGYPPIVRRAIDRVLASMRAAGWDPAVAETHRTDARQAYLHGFGRLYDDGRGIVTYSRTAEDTYHGYWLAVDIFSASRGWDAPREFWRDLGAAYREEGLLWGNDWDNDGIPVEDDKDERFSDRPHGQWPHLRKPSERAKRLRRAGLLSEVWKMAGAA